MANIDIYPFGQSQDTPAGYPTVGRQWSGKKWYAFGTSITVGKYPQHIAELSGMVLEKKAFGGSGITTAVTNTDLYTTIMNFSANDADLITLEAGANDISAPLGTVYDGLSDSSVTNNSTWCGGLNKCLAHLLEVTSAQIVFINSPRQRAQWNNMSNRYNGNEKWGSDHHTVLEMEEISRRVCELNGVYYIPAAGACGMGFARINASNTPNPSDAYVADQIHLTNLGAYNYAQAIWSHLKNIPLFYTEAPTIPT